jgi:hypothetical protein
VGIFFHPKYYPHLIFRQLIPKRNPTTNVKGKKSTMLKLIYLESSLYIEWLESTVEEFIASRKILAIGTGQNIHIECGYASMLVRVELAQLALLQLAIASTNSICLSSADFEYLEVSFSGIWISNNLKPEVAEGVFVADFGSNLEGHLYQIWLQSQPQLTSVG